MGYPSPFKAVSRKLTENIVITSGPFTRMGAFNFGSRMALLRFGDDIIVWSAVPYGDAAQKAIGMFPESARVTHLIVPDKEHTMAAVSYKEQYPNLKIIAPETVDLGASTPIDYKVTKKSAFKVLSNTNLLEEVGIDPQSPLLNLQFVYLPTHQNHELVVYDAASKTLFEADLLFNLGCKEALEQYSPETGYKQGHFPHLGLSFMTRYMHPGSKVGAFLMNKVANASHADTRRGLQAIYSLDFESIVMCHGNVLSQGAKEAFHSVFKAALEHK